MQRSRIVITGAPASGKTACFEQLQTESFLRDVTFLPELARAMLNEKPEWREDWPGFHREIYRRHSDREARIEGSFISDRGTLDGFAFHPESMAEAGTSKATEYARYTAILHLGSTAQLGEPYYTTDDIRTETPDEAMVVERALIRVYSDHPGYRFFSAEREFTRKYGWVREAVRDHLQRPKKD